MLSRNQRMLSVPRVSGQNETNNRKATSALKNPPLQHLWEFLHAASLQVWLNFCLIFHSTVMSKCNSLDYAKKIGEMEDGRTSDWCRTILFTVASEGMDEYFRLEEIPIFLWERSTTNILIYRTRPDTGSNIFCMKIHKLKEKPD